MYLDNKLIKRRKRSNAIHCEKNYSLIDIATKSLKENFDPYLDLNLRNFFKKKKNTKKNFLDIIENEEGFENEREGSCDIIGFEYNHFIDKK